MQDKIYTIGFTKRSAENFYTILKTSNVNVLLDVRLNNTSQLAGFSKYPDIEFFVKELTDIKYIHDVTFAPEPYTLKNYKKGNISWEDYVIQFEETMKIRDIVNYIRNNYDDDMFYCLLCSEHTADKCHRRLVAEKFCEINNDMKIVNL